MLVGCGRSIRTGRLQNKQRGTWKRTNEGKQTLYLKASLLEKKSTAVGGAMSRNKKKGER